jgi:hypothetical protein
VKSGRNDTRNPTVDMDTSMGELMLEIVGEPGFSPTYQIFKYGVIRSHVYVELPESTEDSKSQVVACTLSGAIESAPPEVRAAFKSMIDLGIKTMKTSMLPYYPNKLETE